MVGMHWIDRIKQVKILLVVMAVVIAIASLYVSHYLIRDLSSEEREKTEVWAEAMHTLSMADENTDLNLVLKVINGNSSIPIVVLDGAGHVMTCRNIDMDRSEQTDTLVTLASMAEEMRRNGNSIKLNLSRAGESIKKGDDYIEVCFQESLMLRRLATYPYVQLGVVLIFVVVAIFALLSSKRAEQNKVWVGLSKETAHQLGTPISSLMAWVEILKENYPNDELIPEMDNDVKRLELIAERFSKIGSVPELKNENMQTVLERVAVYMARRASKNISVTSVLPAEPIEAKINAPLFEWVVENLCKNAIDAIGGMGSIQIFLMETKQNVIVDVADTGKGIRKKYHKSVFTPGFTTKKRGWGLGLSLAKRIIEEYHKGLIYVKSSETGKGTTFRIELKKLT